MNKKIISNIADSINKKRRQELFNIYTNDEVKDWITEQQKANWNSKRTGKAGWRKIASIPEEVDIFLTKVYGNDYYKDKNFLKKMCKEWMIIDSRSLQ